MSKFKFEMSIDDEIICNTNELIGIKFRKLENATFNMSILKKIPGEFIRTVGYIKCKGIVPLDIKFENTITIYREEHFSASIISNVNINNISIECDILNCVDYEYNKIELENIRECFKKYNKIYIRDDNVPKKDTYGEYYISEFDYEKCDFRYYRLPSYDDMIDLKIANGCSIEHTVIQKDISNNIHGKLCKINIFVCPTDKQMCIKGVYGSILDKNPNAYSLKLSYDNFTIKE